jgi:hypothetical protein
MKYETAIAILEKIQTRETDLYRDLLLCAVRYARLRTDWRLADANERPAMDAARTAAHNAVIDALNILSRAMVKAGENTAWRKEVGDNRQDIASFTTERAPMSLVVLLDTSGSIAPSSTKSVPPPRRLSTRPATRTSSAWSSSRLTSTSFRTSPVMPHQPTAPWPASRPAAEPPCWIA